MSKVRLPVIPNKEGFFIKHKYMVGIDQKMLSNYGLREAIAMAYMNAASAMAETAQLVMQDEVEPYFEGEEADTDDLEDPIKGRD